MSAVFFLIHLTFSVLVAACVIRTWSNRVRLSLAQQPGPFILALTDWLVLPLRRLLPQSLRSNHWDWASLVATLVLSMVYAGLTSAFGAWRLGGAAPSVGFGILWIAGHFLVVVCLNTLMYTVLAHAVLSWVQPHAPVYLWLERLLQPVLAPLRRIVPRIGGVDVSGLALLLAIQVLLILVG